MSRVSSCYPMTSVDSEGTWEEQESDSRRKLKAAILERSASESPEALAARQDDPGMPKTRSITGGCREMRGRLSEWRMRPRSDEGWDTITRLERGPLGPGGGRGETSPDTGLGLER